MDNILGWIVIILAGGFSLILCLYMVLSLFVVAGYKFYRKFRYGISLFDQSCQEDMNMDIVVIIMGIIAVVAGVAGFVMEHSNTESDQ